MCMWLNQAESEKSPEEINLPSLFAQKGLFSGKAKKDAEKGERRKTLRTSYTLLGQLCTLTCMYSY